MAFQAVALSTRYVSSQLVEIVLTQLFWLQHVLCSWMTCVMVSTVRSTTWSWVHPYIASLPGCPDVLWAYQATNTSPWPSQERPTWAISSFASWSVCSLFWWEMFDMSLKKLSVVFFSRCVLPNRVLGLVYNIAFLCSVTAGHLSTTSVWESLLPAVQTENVLNNSFKRGQ